MRNLLDWFEQHCAIPNIIKNYTVHPNQNQKINIRINNIVIINSNI